MKIQDLDKNFKVQTDITEPDLVWINAREYPFQLHGIVYDEEQKCFLRFPHKVAKTVSEGVEVFNKATTGGRVRFRTDSSFIAVRVVMASYFFTLEIMPRTGTSGFDLYRDLDGKETYFTTFVPPATSQNGYSGGTKTYGELTNYTINFPLYDGVQDLYIGLKKDAILEEATPYKNQRPVVFYGNSITQGGCASRPGNNYQGFLSRLLKMDYVNLGFSGSAKGEPEMARYISDMEMCALVIDYDSNAPTEKHLEETHYNFYKIIRDSNPELPIIILSHPAALHAVHYETKTSSEWGTLENRRRIIRDTYERAKAYGDENIYFIDGRDIFKGEEGDACTVDGVHPNDYGFYRFAKCLEPVLRPFI